jgi:glycosyltransferase involved in cell wall biosynthesis
MREHIHIGMPVFNGDTHLAETLESLLNQTYEDFELFVVDNVSTDGTQDIANAYVRKDSRVKYLRQTEWVSLLPNWNRTYEIAARGVKFFLWASDDDLYHKDYIESLLPSLLQDPQIVLSFSQADEIDMKGERINELYRKSYPKGDTPFKRISSLIPLGKCPAIYGLIRTDAIRWSPCFDATSFPVDLWFLIRLATSGKFQIVKRPLFLKRTGGLGEAGEDPSICRDPLKTWNIGEREWKDICSLNLSLFDKLYTFYRLKLLAKCRYPQLKKIDWFLQPFFLYYMLRQDPHYFGLRSRVRRYLLSRIMHDRMMFKDD